MGQTTRLRTQLVRCHRRRRRRRAGRTRCKTNFYCSFESWFGWAGAVDTRDSERSCECDDPGVRREEGGDQM